MAIPRRPDGRRDRQAMAVPERYRKFLNGELTAEDLDWEELLKGQLRNDDGTFVGYKPRLLPREWHDALAREVLLRAESKFRENYDVAMEAIVAMVQSPRTPAREKLAAAQYIVERTIGKIADKQEVSVQVSKFEKLVENGELIIDLEDDLALPPGKEKGYEDAEELQD